MSVWFQETSRFLEPIMIFRTYRKLRVHQFKQNTQSPVPFHKLGIFVRDAKIASTHMRSRKGSSLQFETVTSCTGSCPAIQLDAVAFAILRRKLFTAADSKQRQQNVQRVFLVTSGGLNRNRTIWLIKAFILRLSVTQIIQYNMVIMFTVFLGQLFCQPPALVRILSGRHLV